MERKIKICR